MRSKWGLRWSSRGLIDHGVVVRYVSEAAACGPKPLGLSETSTLAEGGIEVTDSFRRLRPMMLSAVVCEARNTSNVSTGIQ
jgi:hypothetical protein